MNKKVSDSSFIPPPSSFGGGVSAARFKPDTLARLAEAGLDPDRLPAHVAVIMDGNGRWARQRGKPRVEGHAQGVHSVRSTVEECCRLGVGQLTPARS